MGSVGPVGQLRVGVGESQTRGVRVPPTAFDRMVGGKEAVVSIHWMVLNLPLGILIFALIVVLPYLVMRHEHRNRHTGPRVDDAQLQYPGVRGQAIARLSAYHSKRSVARAKNSSLE